MADISLSKFHSFDNHRLFIPKLHEQSAALRICVICVASYASGLLHGVWIDPTQDAESISDEINRMIAKSPVTDANEWAIYTYSGFGSIVLGDYESIDLIHHKALFLKIYGEWSLKLLEYHHDDVELTEEALVEHYQGKYCTELDFAISLFDKECPVIIPDFVKLYIDYEGFQKDIFKNDYYSIEAEGGVHIFSVL